MINLNSALVSLILPLSPTLVWLALPDDDADDHTPLLLRSTDRLQYLRLNVAQAATSNALPATLQRLVLSAVEGAWGVLAAELPRLTALRKIEFVDTPPDERWGEYDDEDWDMLVATCAEKGIECCFRFEVENGWAG